MLRWESRPRVNIHTHTPETTPEKPREPQTYPRHPRQPLLGSDHRSESSWRMEPSEQSVTPPELTPRSGKRAAVKAAKAEAKFRDPVAFKALRAQQERNRVRNKKLRDAAIAAAASATASGAVASITGQGFISSASSPLPAIPASAIAAACTADWAAPLLGDATMHRALPYGLCPPPPSPVPPPYLPAMPPPFPPPVAALAPFQNNGQADGVARIKDGRTFEQKRIKELELKVQSLEEAVSTRDAELKGYADSLRDTVAVATEMRDADDLAHAGSAIRGYMIAVPHKPEGSCDCVFCIALSFLAPPLKHRATCMARMRAENDM